MEERVEALVAQLLELRQALAGTLASLPPAAWQQIPSGEERSVAQVAYHVAAGYLITFSFVQMILRGESFPAPDAAEMHGINARQAAEHAGAGRDEVLALLESEGAALTAALGGLTDEQLDCPGTIFGYPMTAQIAIEAIVLRHIREHLETIQSVAAPAALA